MMVQIEKNILECSKARRNELICRAMLWAFMTCIHYTYIHIHTQTPKNIRMAFPIRIIDSLFHFLFLFFCWNTCIHTHTHIQSGIRKICVERNEISRNVKSLQSTSSPAHLCDGEISTLNEIHTYTHTQQVHWEKFVNLQLLSFCQMLLRNSLSFHISLWNIKQRDFQNVFCGFFGSIRKIFRCSHGMDLRLELAEMCQLFHKSESNISCVLLWWTW